jgi:2-polyprenyl-3-methyl-5-hydroxy-6-metoxy-1,4-benzoquinol methylase
MTEISKKKILNKIKELNFNYEGSGRGNLYQEIPFKEFTSFDLELKDIQRTDNFLHLKFFEDIDLKGKNVLDIGCNIGYFCFKLADQGAICYGIDHDPDSIELANLFKKYKNYDNVHFFKSKFNKNFVEKILEKNLKFDIIIFFSVIHWLMNDFHSISHIIDLFRKLLNKTQIFFYEPSSTSEAYYPELLKKDNIINFFKRIGYDEYKKVGSHIVSWGGFKRETWKASVNFPKLVKMIYNKKGLQNCNNNKLRHFDENYYVKIVKRKNNPFYFLTKNEIKMIKNLKDFKNVPYFYGTINFREFTFLISENLNLHQLYKFIRYPTFNRAFIKGIPKLEKKLYQILEGLKKKKIVHRDLLPTNILIDNKFERTYIIDFEFAMKDDKKIQTKNSLEKKILKKYETQILCGSFRHPDFHNKSYEIDEYTIGEVLYRLKRLNHLSRILRLLCYIYEIYYQLVIGLKNKQIFQILINRIQKIFALFKKIPYIKEFIFYQRLRINL